MSFMNLSLKKAYYSDFDDVLQDFYIPSLTESIEYRRLAGFFSSSSLAVAARGILGLIKNGGVMKLDSFSGGRSLCRSIEAGVSQVLLK